MTTAHYTPRYTPEKHAEYEALAQAATAGHYSAGIGVSFFDEATGAPLEEPQSWVESLSVTPFHPCPADMGEYRIEFPEAGTATFEQMHRDVQFLEVAVDAVLMLSARVRELEAKLTQ